MGALKATSRNPEMKASFDRLIAAGGPVDGCADRRGPQTVDDPQRYSP